MRVIFMGTPEFAVPSLNALVTDHDVVAVYSRPDAVSGRGGSTRPSAVATRAHELGLPVRTPRTLRDTGEHAALRELAPDIGVVAAYGLILPPEIIEIPRFGFVNVHASLLPRWRGAAPIQRAILAGDDVTGISVMRMEEGLDTGPYCEVVRTPVEDKNAVQLSEELADLGAHALQRALTRITDGTCTWTEQDEAHTTYAEKLSKDDVALAPRLSATETLRRIRASSRQAPARLMLAGTTLTVVDAGPAQTSPDEGTVQVVGKHVVLGTADGGVELLTIKPEGRREMPASAWLCGAAVPRDATWTSVA